MTRLNEHDQPIGPDMGSWVAPGFPAPTELVGRTVRLEPLDASGHAAALFEVLGDAPGSLWTYLPFGPVDSAEAMAMILEALIGNPTMQPFAVVVDGRPVGFFTLMRIDPPGGVIEIGSVVFSPLLQRSTAATEAMFLLIDHVFALGYRRCEWKCDHHNAPSRAAAKRFGFAFEGIFAKATHYKGRSRDTAWFAITDDEWPPRRSAFEAWLAPANFDEEGQQLSALAAHSAPSNRPE